MTQPPATSYDAVPFPGLAIAASQPERLATIGLLRGLQPADPAEARVLEFGCATGQNLLPLAERYPGATLLGIDNSERQIEAARQLAGQAGLPNVSFRCQDLAQLPSDLGQFDYIIAHAVYSWVDAATRDRLLELIGQCLAPQGLAFVSYNTYPGWNVHELLRAAMLYDSRTASTPAQRIGMARNLLGFLEATLTDESPYSKVVRHEVGHLLQQKDAYLLHDHLEAVNQPVYYSQFVAHARGRALQVAGDCVLDIRAGDRLGPEAEHELAVLTADPVEREQFRDIVRHRGIRQTVLCRADATLTEQPPEGTFEKLYLEAPLRPEAPTGDAATGEVLASEAGEEVTRFLGTSGLRISTSVPIIRHALANLGESWPRFVPWEELVNAAVEQTSEASPSTAVTDADQQRLRDSLRQSCYGGAIQAHCRPQSYVTQASERPLAGRLARHQATLGDIVTNRRHEAVRLDPIDRNVLELLDGQRDRAAIVDALCAAAQQGRFVVFQHQQLVQNADQAREVLSSVVPEALERLARGGFLIA